VGKWRKTSRGKNWELKDRESEKCFEKYYTLPQVWKVVMFWFGCLHRSDLCGLGCGNVEKILGHKIPPSRSDGGILIELN